MRDFRTVYINDETVKPSNGIRPFFGFAIEDYLELCLQENVCVPIQAKLFGFCMTDEDEFGTEWNKSLAELLKAIDIENISIIVIDYNAVTSFWGVDLLVYDLDSVLLRYGFSREEAFKDTYESRFVYIGDTDDGFQLKRQLRLREKEA